MVESSKILTVSYGTFSCTLEGFDDSFGTMKAIAEYFRDLAERDRYFGAEPPTPDAEMLTRIAEREIERRVEARMDDNGIVLRAAEDQTPAPAAAPVVAPVMAPVAEAPAMPPQPTPPADAPAFAENVETTEAADVEEAPLAQEDEAPLVLEEVQTEAEAAEAEAEVAELSDAEDEADVSDDTSDDDALTFADMSPADLETAPATTDDESVAAKLRRIRAVVGKETTQDETSERTDENAPFVSSDDAEDSDAPEASLEEVLAEETPDASEAVSDFMTSEDDAAPVAEVEEVEEIAETEEPSSEVEAVEEASEPEQAEDHTAEEDDVVEASETEATDFEVNADDVVETAAEDAADTAEEQVEDAEPVAAKAEEKPARQSVRARILRVARPLRPTAVDRITESAELSEEINSLEAEDADQETAPSAEIDDVDSLISRVKSSTAAEPVEQVEDTVNGSTYELSADEQVEEAPQAELAEDTSDVEEFAAEATEDFDADELETEADAAEEVVSLSDEDEADLQEELAEVAREIEETKASSPTGRDILPENDDAAMSRILNRADEQLAEPESSRRRNAIAQLKAAVAATEAARQLGDQSDADKPEAEFRKDLNDVVRPRRASNLPKAKARTERPRPTPLKLVASQRVDAPADPVQPVTPRRVATITTGKDAGNFAEFAEKMGATELEDLLEAAAAYTAFVEGNEDFSRPQIMQKVQATSETGYSREDSLRSFGTLLREGRISKVRNGRFQINQQTRFKPEQKAG